MNAKPHSLHRCPASAGWWISLLVSLLTPLALAAAAEKKDFDIAGGDALATLKQFSGQSEARCFIRSMRCAA
ncbi:MAG: hypothetical protein ACREIA_18695 [Opitutaceae bacterium]